MNISPIEDIVANKIRIILIDLIYIVESIFSHCTYIRLNPKWFLTLYSTIETYSKLKNVSKCGVEITSKCVICFITSLEINKEKAIVQLIR